MVEAENKTIKCARYNTHELFEFDVGGQHEMVCINL